VRESKALTTPTTRTSLFAGDAGRSIVIYYVRLYY
jgi:hypothetical protein